MRFVLTQESVIGDWNAEAYDAFGDQRQRAAKDLLAGIGQLDPDSIVDLGCGSGLSTEILRLRWPKARIQGIDLSPDMLSQAASRVPDADFALGDIADYQPDAPVDLIFANASLHWVGAHQKLLPRLLLSLTPGGVLALQMPANLDEPSHRLMRDIIDEPPYADALGSGRPDRPALQSSEVYYDCLCRAGAQVDIWTTSYRHVLASASSIADWFATTGLKPYEDALAEPLRAAYRSDYVAALEQAYPQQQDGKVLLRMPRLFIVARRNL